MRDEHIFSIVVFSWSFLSRKMMSSEGNTIEKVTASFDWTKIKTIWRWTRRIYISLVIWSMSLNKHTKRMTLMFDCLPNEICLIIFSYLSSRHVCKAFFGVNQRFDRLLTSDLIRHTIEMKGISHAEIMELIADSNIHSLCQWQTVLLSATHAICLEYTSDYEYLFNRWIMMKKHWCLPSLRVVHVLPEAIKSIWLLFSNQQLLTFLQSQLHCLHLVFDTPSYTYMRVLQHMIQNHISYPKMILQVTRGSYSRYTIQVVYWRSQKYKTLLDD